MPVPMLQLSLRDNGPLRIPVRGLKPTATIKSRSATNAMVWTWNSFPMSHLHQSGTNTVGLASITSGIGPTVIDSLILRRTQAQWI
jgi:hypothetical protein